MSWRGSLRRKSPSKSGVAVVIENKGGANGNIGAEIVAKAPADGYTLLYNTSFIVTNPVLYSSLSYDPVRDFSPVILIAKVPLILVAHPSVPANSAAEFIAYARSNPDKLNYASSGTGGSTHLATLLFLKASGISATHVPYRGGGPALIDLIAGNVQFYSDTANTALPYIQDNRLKALAVTASQRIRDLPETPTVAETIKAEFDVVSWQGLMAPAGTPRPIIERLNAGVSQGAAGSRHRRQAQRTGRHPGGHHNRGVRKLSPERGRALEEDDRGRQHQG